MLAREAEALAHLVREKTGGNPFFVKQFLTALHDHGVITFDRGARRWRWDLARIRALGYTDNVVELMVGKLHDLPAETQQALKLAACLGASMDADALGVVFEGEPEAALRAAFEADLLLRTNGSYRFLARSGPGGGLLAHPRQRAGDGAPAHRAAACWRARRPRSSRMTSSTSSTSSIKEPRSSRRKRSGSGSPGST